MTTPPVTDTGRQRIFLVFGGPKYELDGLQKRLNLLSRNYSGVCFTSYQEAKTWNIGNFEVVTVRWGDGGLPQSLRFFAKGLQLAWRERRQRPKAGLVMTTDTLKSGLMGWLIARIAGIKFAPEVNGEYADKENYDDLRGVQRWLKWKIYTGITAFVLRRSDGIRLLYRGQIDYIRGGLDGKIIHPISEVVYTDLFKDLGESKEVLFVGFPFYRKGVDLLIEAFKRVAPKHPEWKLKILGWFADQQLLQSHIGEHPQIFHHPPVKYDLMPEHVGRCAILVLPSRSEGMGRVLIEAMAAKKPRIGARTGGIPSVIDHETDGFLFDVGNVDQLAEQLDRLMSDPALRRRFGEVGYQRAQAQFTPEKYLEHVTEFYSTVIAGGRSRDERTEPVSPSYSDS